jgi:RNAse (barnase) inhibitor barstar
LKKDKTHQKELDDYRFIWQQAKTIQDEIPLNIDAAWIKLKSKIDLPIEAKVVRFTPKKQIFISQKMY